MQYVCHQFVPAAMIRVATALLVTVWIVCSDSDPFVCTEQAGCALAAATGLVEIFQCIGVFELIFLALRVGTIDASSGVAECDRFWVATLVLEADSLIDI